MEDFMMTTSLNAGELMGNTQFKQALEQYGWTTEPRYTGSIATFYNQFKNASFNIEQKGGFVEITVNNYVGATNEVLDHKVTSDLQGALGWSIQRLQQYANYDLFGNTNNYF